MTSLISRTGRVQNWIDDPDSRLPVSCTVFVVEDSMEGPNGIEASGDSSATLSDLELALLSIYLSSEPKEVKTAKVLQLLDQYRLEKSIQP